MGKGTPLGRILGSGAEVTGKAFGVERVPVVKGQAMPAYDPRAVQGIGVTYATSTMGADHTAGYAVATNILKVGGFVDPAQARRAGGALAQSADRDGRGGFHRHVPVHPTFGDDGLLEVSVLADDQHVLEDSEQVGTGLDQVSIAVLPPVCGG